MTKKNKIIVSGLTILTTLSVIGQIHKKEKGRIEFDEFNDDEISGKIETKVDASVSGTYFKVRGKKYKFHPYTAEINSYSIFSYTAGIGDSVFKVKGGDTLVLFKAGRTYKYTFLKMVEK